MGARGHSDTTARRHRDVSTAARRHGGTAARLHGCTAARPGRHGGTAAAEQRKITELAGGLTRPNYLDYEVKTLKLVVFKFDWVYKFATNNPICG